MQRISRPTDTTKASDHPALVVVPLSQIIIQLHVANRRLSLSGCHSFLHEQSTGPDHPIAYWSGFLKEADIELIYNSTHKEYPAVILGSTVTEARRERSPIQKKDGL